MHKSVFMELKGTRFTVRDILIFHNPTARKHCSIWLTNNTALSPLLVNTKRMYGPGAAI